MKMYTFLLMKIILSSAITIELEASHLPLLNLPGLDYMTLNLLLNGSVVVSVQKATLESYQTLEESPQQSGSPIAQHNEDPSTTTIQVTTNPTTNLITSSSLSTIATGISSIASTSNTTFTTSTPTTGCGEFEFSCGSGECIHNVHQCDGVNACQDGSDELGCGNCTIYRGREGFQCPERAPGSGIFSTITLRDYCIFKSAICDGYPNCIDGSEEDSCEECSPGAFRCANGQCILDSLRCDDKPNCKDGSDEVNCGNCSILQDKEGIKLSPVPSVKESCRECNPGEFNCSSGQCIPGFRRCDFSRECSSESFRCANGQCINGRGRCNGWPQCEDESDEVDCDNEPNVYCSDCGLFYDPIIHQCIRSYFCNVLGGAFSPCLPDFVYNRNKGICVGLYHRTRSITPVPF